MFSRVEINQSSTPIYQPIGSGNLSKFVLLYINPLDKEIYPNFYSYISTHWIKKFIQILHVTAKVGTYLIRPFYDTL